MSSVNPNMHFVSATGIVVKNGKYLIARRAGWEKAFPNQWTVPGGKLNVADYVSREKDAKELWYNVIEELVKREVKEEVNLEFSNLRYLTSMTFIRPDGAPALILSFFCEYKSGEVKLCDALTEFAWVSLEEAKSYDLIDGIWDELVLLDRFLKTGRLEQWKRG